MRKFIRYLVFITASLTFPFVCSAQESRTEGVYVEPDEETVQTEEITEAETEEIMGVSPSDDFEYIIDTDDNAKIVLYVGDSSDVSLPEEIEGHAVTSIGEKAFMYCGSVEKIRIGSSIVEIEGNPFAECGSLKEIVLKEGNEIFAVIDGALFEKSTRALIACPGGYSGTYEIPDGIRKIGDYAFSGCRQLSGVVVPETVTDIGDYAFSSCAALESITIPVNLTELGEYAFVNCSNLAELIFTQPAVSSLEKIRDGVFYGCKHLTSVELPSSVKQIGTEAFRFCGLYAIELPPDLIEIGDWAFASCENLGRIRVRGNVKKIGAYAFADCYSAVELNLEEGIEKIGDYAFRAASIDEVMIPSSVKEIGINPFVSCGNLESIRSSVEQRMFSVVDNGLYDTDERKLICYSPGVYEENVVIPEGIEALGDSCFTSFSGMREITLPSSLREVGGNTFEDCSDLETVLFLGDGLQSVGERAFSMCISLKEVRLPNTCSAVGKYCFSGCEELESVRLPLPLQSISDGLFENCVKLSRASLPEITTIGYRAFSGCNQLAQIVLPQTVRSIGAEAFCGCAFSEVTVPAGVPYIMDYTFMDCENLQKITLPEQLKMIGKGAFLNCTALRNAGIPEGTVAIGDRAFSGCSTLQSVSVPSSVKYIGSKAFRGCSGLYHMNLPDSITSPASLTQEDILVLNGMYDPYSVEKGREETEKESGIAGETEAETKAETEILEETETDNPGDTLPETRITDDSYLKNPGIAEDAYEGCRDLTLTVEKGSYGMQYAVDHGLDYDYPDSHEWLNR